MRNVFAALVCIGLLFPAAGAVAQPTTQPTEAPSSEAPATQPLPELAANDTAGLRAHFGKHVIVTGTVRTAEMAKSGKVFRIHFDGVPNDGFQVVVFAADFKDVDAAFSGGLAKALPGKTIKVEGLVDEYRGRPESIIRNAKQVRIVEKP